MPAAGLGFEPRWTVPETVILPLDDPANVAFATSGIIQDMDQGAIAWYARFRNAPPL